MDVVLGLLVLVGIVVFVLWILKASGYDLNEPINRYDKKRTTYSYAAKSSLMTRTEMQFYRTLINELSSKYYVFPQVHLSALVKSLATGKQAWRAFLHINGKSVDYVLCAKDSLRPVCAIELDDYTHRRQSRIKRDAEVERILAEAGVPLVRVKDPQTVDFSKLYNYVSQVSEQKSAASSY